MQLFSCLQRWIRSMRRLPVQCVLCLKVTRQSHYLCVACSACCCRGCVVEDAASGHFYCRWCTKDSNRVVDRRDEPASKRAHIHRIPRKKKEPVPVLDYSDVPVLEVKTAKMLLTSRQVLAIRNMASSVHRLAKSA